MPASTRDQSWIGMVSPTGVTLIVRGPAAGVVGDAFEDTGGGHASKQAGGWSIGRGEKDEGMLTLPGRPGSRAAAHPQGPSVPGQKATEGLEEGGPAALDRPHRKVQQRRDFILVLALRDEEPQELVMIGG